MIRLRAAVECVMAMWSAGWQLVGAEWVRGDQRTPATKVERRLAGDR